MSSFEELRSAVQDSLEHNGSLGEIRAKLRAEIFSALQHPTETKPKLPNENLIINELILEYLNYNHLNCAAFV